MPLESGHEREARYDQVAAHYRQHPPDRLEELWRAFHRLLLDLALAGGDLDAESRGAWPSAPTIVSQEFTLGEQFAVIDVLATRLLDTYQRSDAAELLQQVRAVLMKPAFVAPPMAPRTLTPPRPIHLAIERLRSANRLPIDLANLPTDDGQNGRDQRLLAFWLQSLGD
jgi:hypothetical protein